MESYGAVTEEHAANRERDSAKRTLTNYLT